MDNNHAMVDSARSTALDAGMTGLSVCQGGAADLHRLLQEVHSHACAAFALACFIVGASASGTGR